MMRVELVRVTKGVCLRGERRKVHETHEDDNDYGQSRDERHKGCSSFSLG